MSYSSTIFEVMIASPSDVQVERNIVREVVYDWNTIHSKVRGLVLFPRGWETDTSPAMGDRPQAIINAQVLEDIDLLVAIFWTRIGSPSGKAVSGTVEEIEEHLAAGKPAMIYFSSSPVHPDSVDNDQYGALKAFREECRKRGLIETYESPADFRNKFTRQLAKTINENEYFTVNVGSATEETAEDLADTVKDLSELVATPLVRADLSSISQLSKEAKQLLLEAAKEKDGSILRFHHLGGVTIQTNRQEFVEPHNARSAAIWEAAVDELEKGGLIKDESHKGEFYHITRRGYEIAELLAGG